MHQIVMRSSRKIIGEFAAVFLIGAVVGGLVVWDFTDTKLSTFMSRTNDPAAMAAHINQKYATDYQLSSDELNRIQPLIQEMAQHVSQVRRQFGVDIIATLDNYHQKIAEQLTPEHRAAYEQANQEHKKKLSSMLLLDESAPDPGQK